MPPKSTSPVSPNPQNTKKSSASSNSSSTTSTKPKSLLKDNLSALSKQDVIIPSQGHNYTKLQIREIQSAIEKGLSLYKSKMEIFAVLKNVDQNVVNLVWQKLEQNNPRFFTAYLLRLAVIKQIKVFQQLVVEQDKLRGAMRQGGMGSAQGRATNAPMPSAVSPMTMGAPGSATGASTSAHPYVTHNPALMMQSMGMVPPSQPMGATSAPMYTQNQNPTGSAYDPLAHRRGSVSGGPPSASSMPPPPMGQFASTPQMMQFNPQFMQQVQQMHQFGGANAGSAAPPQYMQGMPFSAQNYSQMMGGASQNSPNESYNPYASFGSFTMGGASSGASGSNTGSTGGANASNNAASQQFSTQKSNSGANSKDSNDLLDQNDLEILGGSLFD